MKKNKHFFNKRQILFKELFVGTLLYAVVLGFFNDYTSFVFAKSFSTIFLASLTLQILTFGALRLKSAIITALRDKRELLYRLCMFFSVWLVMFLSKFFFTWIIDALFGAAITIYGFFGILAVVVSSTALHKIGDTIFLKLGNQKRNDVEKYI